MRHCFGLTAGLLLISSQPSFAEGCAGWPDSATPTIAVRVYDYAGVPPAIGKRAREESGRIFREAGVAAEWTLCTVPGQVMAVPPRCQPRATDIQLNILSARMARKMMRHRSELGLAVPATNGFGRIASIFYHRVDELAESGQASRALLLGHVMAHEIGHLLLGVTSHSATGLMQDPWGRDQRERASLGTLLFTDKEAEQIRLQVAARVCASQALR